MNAPAKAKVHPAWERVYSMQRLVAALNADIAALRQWLASQDLPDPAMTECPRCGLSCAGTNTLAEHVYYQHDGPVPAHWGDDA